MALNQSNSIAGTWPITIVAYGSFIMYAGEAYVHLTSRSYLMKEEILKPQMVAQMKLANGLEGELFAFNFLCALMRCFHFFTQHYLVL